MLGNITASWALCARLSQLQDEGCAADRHWSLGQGLVHCADA
jgi:glutaryl-CoA dehydrogenase